MKLYQILILFFIVAIGCKKDGANLPEVQMTPNKTQVKNLEIVTLIVKEFSLDKDLYSGKFGDQDIQIGKSNDTTLVFMVPESLPIGNYDFSIEISSNIIGFSIIQGIDIPDPEAYFNEALNGTNVFLEQNCIEFNIPTDAPEVLDIKDNMENALGKFDLLSEQEKIFVARFIASNRELYDLMFQQLKDIPITKKGVPGLNINLKEQLNNIALLEFFSVAVLTITTIIIQPALPVAIAAFAIIVVVDFWTQTQLKTIVLAFKNKLTNLFEYVYFAHEKLYKKEVFVEENSIITKILSEFSTQKNLQQSYYYGSSVPVTFQIKPVYKTMDETDVYSSQLVVSKFVGLYLKLKAIWKSVTDKYGMLPDFIKKEEERMASSLTQYSLAITQNSGNVNCSSINGTPANFTVAFSNKTFVEQAFSFELKYTDGVQLGKRSFTGILKSGLGGTSWAFRYFMVNSTFTGTITFNNNGTVHYVEPVSGTSPIVFDGTYSQSGNSINIFMGNINFKGTISGNSMSGTYQWNSTTSYTWSATKK